MQNSYLVLARKYRPTSFSELVGQDILVKVLTNSIKNNKLHHGFILTGIRGVGKTTTARIIAKTINCLDPNSVIQANCCNVCSNCSAINLSKHPDIIEIDAASRTGVGDIREIIDSIAYAPISAKYKIYIIDEFHMLSNSAFNALLKTLEEPPSNVKFIFATTEIKKVPITIISRCQKFDLKRLSNQELANHLANILQKEQISFNIDALNLIASVADGSVRDSLSLLDQALCFNNYQNFLNLEVVEEMLGFGNKSLIFSLFEAISSGNFALSLEIFAQFYLSSCDINYLVINLMELTATITNKKLAPNYSIMPKITFEMMMAKICYISQLPQIDNIINFNFNKNLIENKENHTNLAKNSNELSVSIEQNLDNCQNDNFNKNTSMQMNEAVLEVLNNFSNSKIIE